ncbi:MAG: HEAT repeat domain-containing protein [Sphingobacteriales bacterium]|nr:MAG: HEAT repeat domain-containing protein [Sphingobacteriales bacterium]
MGFYDLPKEERAMLVQQIQQNLLTDIVAKMRTHVIRYFADADTYIRKSAYLSLGRLYTLEVKRRIAIIELLNELLLAEDFKIRQTAINAAGEIGKTDFQNTEHFFDAGLFDEHHSVRNAVIGSIKKMGEKNPVPVVEWARKYLHHPDKEIRREICHGIELRGRTHPQDILPLLKELQFDKTARVRNTLVHVIGQISYKKGCLQTVMHDIILWDNKQLVAKAIDEIIDVHDRYKDFAALTQAEAVSFIEAHLKLHDSSHLCNH